MQDVVHVRPTLGAAVLEDVEGFTSASPRQSLTTGAGALRVAPIDGVRYRLARPVPHHHGHLGFVWLQMVTLIGLTPICGAKTVTFGYGVVTAVSLPRWRSGVTA